MKTKLEYWYKEYIHYKHYKLMNCLKCPNNDTGTMKVRSFFLLSLPVVFFSIHELYEM